MEQEQKILRAGSLDVWLMVQVGAVYALLICYMLPWLDMRPFMDYSVNGYELPGFYHSMLKKAYSDGSFIGTVKYVGYTGLLFVQIYTAPVLAVLGAALCLCGRSWGRWGMAAGGAWFIGWRVWVFLIQGFSFKGTNYAVVLTSVVSLVLIVSCFLKARMSKQVSDEPTAVVVFFSARYRQAAAAVMIVVLIGGMGLSNIGWALKGWKDKRGPSGTRDPFQVNASVRERAPSQASLLPKREVVLEPPIQEKHDDKASRTAHARELWNSQRYDELLPLATELANEDEPNGANYLGLIYSNGLGVPRDVERGVRYFKQALSLGPAAEFNVGWTLLVSRGDDSQRLQEGMQYLERAAEGGFAQAQKNLADIYDRGDPAPQDLKKAVHYYELCAAQEVADCKAILGNYYLDGLGGKNVDEKTGMKLVEESVDKGSTVGMRILGNHYASLGGEGREKASFYYKKAIANGDGDAPIDYASFLLSNSSGDGDIAEAIRILQEPASKGHVMAIAILAKALLLPGSNRNAENGLKYLQQAADGGVLGSRIRLSVILNQGELTPHNPELAAKYRQLAVSDAAPQQLLVYAKSVGTDPTYRRDACEEAIWLEEAKKKSSETFSAESELENARVGCERQRQDRY